MDNSELTCIVCRGRFIPVFNKQQCCMSECAIRAGKAHEIIEAMEVFDDMHRKAWAAQMSKTYEN